MEKQVIIKFTRHAKRRAKLYKIPKELIVNILKNIDTSQGEHEIIKYVEGFKYPLKIVFVVENNILTVITNYPLKRGYKK
ncbi:hypothetical protein OWM07_07640 [Deferribacter thermophilus]|uniref:hypothetical protein n=1 Tax=Deferribacter thermophilus TaxID=53573 RepID=UPI003C1D4340